jgi:hypothetical protein
MTTKSQPLTANLFQAMFAGAFVALVAAVGVAGGSQAKGRIESQPALASFEASVMPKARPTWQRPAPATWSSRFNVRWEARWSSEGKYMV